MSKGTHILWYNHPAKEWDEALPLGNGSLGAMVFGDVDKETVTLNLDTIWAGYPHKYAVDNKVEHFKKIRDLALEEKYLEANNYARKNFQGDNCDPYLQLGKLIITSNKHMCPKKYTRQLDISTAVFSSEYFANDTVYNREAFVSNPDKVFVYRFKSEGKNKLDFNVMIHSELKHEVRTEGNTYLLKGICPSHVNGNEDNPEPIYLDGDKRGISFSCMFKIVTDGRIKTNKNHLCVAEADEAIIYLTITDNFTGWNTPIDHDKNCSIECNEILVAAMAKGYSKVKADHSSDHKSYYDRVSIDLGKSKKTGTPTDRRLHEFLTNKDNDNDLYCLLFNYGRYLTIAASREGSQPMNLQGIWTYQLRSPWSSNYTTNINTEMNYWPTLICSMPELTQPLIKFISELSESGKEVAEKYYGAGGFCIHHNVDLWRIPTPAKGSPVWSFWPMAGAWLCRHLYEQYEYTLNKDFLRDTAMPIMESSARFCLDMLVDDGNGNLIFAPSTSPENDYWVGKELCAINKTTYMTMEIVRDNFDLVLAGAAALGISDNIIEEIKEKYPKLLPFKKGAKGELLEWYSDEVSTQPHHRHVSHLYALHPANQIDVDRTPEWADAAIKTLELRGDDGTGWSLGWKISFWAKLRNKDKVIKLIDTQLRYVKPKASSGGGGTYPNMFDAHPPFQIDGNFAATCGIAQALMQSDGKRILILPALPTKWANGHIHGLTARGNVKVNIDWKDNKLTKLVIDGNGSFDIIYNKTTVKVTLNGKKEVKFDNR